MAMLNVVELIGPAGVVVVLVAIMAIAMLWATK